MCLEVKLLVVGIKKEGKEPEEINYIISMRRLCYFLSISASELPCSEVTPGQEATVANPHPLMKGLEE